MHLYLWPFKTILFNGEHFTYLMIGSWCQAFQDLFLFAPFANDNMKLNVCPVLDLVHSPLNTSASFKCTASIADKRKP